VSLSGHLVAGKGCREEVVGNTSLTAQRYSGTSLLEPGSPALGEDSFAYQCRLIPHFARKCSALLSRPWVSVRVTAAWLGGHDTTSTGTRTRHIFITAVFLPVSSSALLCLLASVGWIDCLARILPELGR